MQPTGSFLNEDEVKYANCYEVAHTVALAALGFMVPFTFGHPQLLVGVLVNAMIIRAAMTLPKDKAMAVVLTPVVGAIARGMVFGPFTIFLVFMAPFIWMGNFVLAWAMRAKANYLLKLVAGSTAKAAFLFGTAYVLYSAGILPEIFLTSMGVMQLMTALLGGALAYGGFKAERALWK